MKYLFHPLKAFVFQVVLSLFAYETFCLAFELGEKHITKEGSIIAASFDDIENRGLGYFERTPTSVDIANGFNGGSIAMGLICATCVFLVIWIEINNSSRYSSK